MNQKEFKALDDSFFKKLGEELNKKQAGYTLLGVDPFGRELVGCYHKESPNFFEVYLYWNNGNEAGFEFAGHQGA